MCLIPRTAGVVSQSVSPPDPSDHNSKVEVLLTAPTVVTMVLEVVLVAINTFPSVPAAAIAVPVEVVVVLVVIP